MFVLVSEGGKILTKGGNYMLLNEDVPYEVKKLMKKEGYRLIDVARMLGVGGPSITTRLNGNIVAKGVVEILDVIGYDVKIEFVKK